MKLPTLLALPLTRYNVSEGHMACPLCHATEYRPLAAIDRRLKRLDHGVCTTCGLVRQVPLPSEAALEQYYASDYRADYHLVFRAPSESKRQKRLAVAKPRLDRIAAFLPAGGRVLDFGCGSGEFIETCNAAGFSASGFEPGEDYAHYAREERKLEVQTGRWQDVSFEGLFSGITSFHVFEHLVDPCAALERMLTWLEPDGVIYLETPNALHGIERKGFASLHFAHTLGFTRYSMEALGAKVGLTPVAVMDDANIGMIFQRGAARRMEEIFTDARAEWAGWTQGKVHAQFPKYLVNKAFGRL